MNMSFFSSQTRANTNAPNKPKFVMGMYPIRPPPMVEPVHDYGPIVNKVKWGEPTWYLFHVLSVKVKDSEFSRIRQDLLNNIYSICLNLPCPICADHAKDYLNGINFNTIQTKEDLQRLLYVFHNSVNERKGYSMFPWEDFQNKYSLAITTNIIRNFMAHFSEKSRNPKLNAGDFLRMRLVGILKQWFNENIGAFHP